MKFGAKASQGILAIFSSSLPGHFHAYHPGQFPGNPAPICLPSVMGDSIFLASYLPFNSLAPGRCGGNFKSMIFNNYAEK